jgi:hypothetical protein
MDHCNAARKRVVWLTKTNHASIDPKFACVRLVNPGQQLYQSGFARTVFTH